MPMGLSVPMDCQRVYRRTSCSVYRKYTEKGANLIWYAAITRPHEGSRQA
jgi:hypothetical protein